MGTTSRCTCLDSRCLARGVVAEQVIAYVRGVSSLYDLITVHMFPGDYVLLYFLLCA